jgi:broad specificity phosphatase PhoE
MRRLTLIRHALTDWNRSGRFQGRSDVPLADAGRAQSLELRAGAGALGRVDVLVSSPSLRALQTAELAFPGHAPMRDERLREIDFGAFEGRTMPENQAHPAWSWWITDPIRRPAPRGESYGGLQMRAVAWLEEASRRWPGAHVVAVSHSGTIQMLLAHLFGITRPRWSIRLEVGHTSVSQVRFEEGMVIVERVNDMRHARPGAGGRGS